MEVRLWHLDANVQHPDIVERQLAIVSTEHVQLALYYIGCVTTAWSRPVIACLHLFPLTMLNVEDMHVIHPVCAIIAAKVVDL